jgi:hypothetical protein
MKAGEDRLDSWKAIADYLGRDRTTVMRWERTSGLPVRRVAGAKGHSVFAYKSEIDKWLETQTDSLSEFAARAPAAPPASWRRRMSPVAIGMAAAGGIVVGGLAVGFGLTSRTVVASASLAGGHIAARAADGRSLWRYALPNVEGGIQAAKLAVADVDYDGRPEVVAALQVFVTPGQGYGLLLVLDDSGKMRWSRTLDVRYRFGEIEYRPGWFPADIVVYRAGGQTRIAVAENHHTWWPAVVSTYDRDGILVGQFVNTGWVTSLVTTSDGRYLLAAGVNNSLGGASLAVLDAMAPSGTSPQDGGKLPRCTNCPSGSPQRYFIAPWTDLAVPSDSRQVVVQVAADGTIQWRAPQRAVASGKVPEVIISLSPSLQVRERAVNDYFVELHDALERTGEIPRNWGHGRQPVVREWTADGGWR